jgi:DNA polymerase I
VEIELFPIDIDYIVVDGKPVVRIFGLAEKGERRIIYDESFQPYCYVDAEKSVVESATKGMSFVDRIEEKEKTRLGRKLKVCQIFTKLPEDVPKIRQLSMATYDADIPFYKRYMLDKGLGTSYRIKVDLDGDKLKKIINVTSGNPPLKSIALDIETYTKRAFPDAKVDPILAVSLANYNIKKCFTWLDTEGEGIEKVKDEKDLIMKVARFISENSFNTIIGYNSDSFDLPYIKQRADILGIKPLFNGFEIKIKGDKRKVCEINGSVHIDIFSFIRNIYAVYNLKTEILSLREVAFEVLGEKKGEFDWNYLENVFSDRKIAGSLCTYCNQDAYLAFRLYERLYNLFGELNKLIGQTLSDVSRMTTGSVVEHLIMKKAIELGELIPNRPSDFEVNERMHRMNVGAFVFQPKPGLYQEVGVVDFRSLYPSIIVSRNICPSTIRFDGGKAIFIPKEERVGFIPSILDELIKLRIEAKHRLKEDKENQQLNARVTVLKLITNGFYGYLGYYNARWYCFECAGEVTALGREYVHKVIDAAEKHNANVMYADTDSCFLHKNNIKEFLDGFVTEINKTLPYPMELEIQGVYKSALFVTTKAKEKGAKKKYALCDEKGKLIVKGFQSVRRDWALIAKETQITVLKKILVDDDKEGALEYVKEIIKKIKSGDVPLEELMILTRLHKDILSYKQTGRHVSAATKSGLEFSSGDTIKYIISKGRPGESVSFRSILFDIAKKNKIKYDPDYYINQQIVPSTLQILSVLGYSEQDLIENKNRSLSGFLD